VAKFLLESKAKANTRDKNGWSAAVWALAMGHLGVLQVLADFGVRREDENIEIIRIFGVGILNPSS